MLLYSFLSIQLNLPLIPSSTRSSFMDNMYDCISIYVFRGSRKTSVLLVSCSRKMFETAPAHYQSIKRYEQLLHCWCVTPLGQIGGLGHSMEFVHVTRRKETRSVKKTSSQHLYYHLGSLFNLLKGLFQAIQTKIRFQPFCCVARVPMCFKHDRARPAWPARSA